MLPHPCIIYYQDIIQTECFYVFVTNMIFYLLILHHFYSQDYSTMYIPVCKEPQPNKTQNAPHHRSQTPSTKPTPDRKTNPPPQNPKK